jgi:hypothetical protein
VSKAGSDGCHVKNWKISLKVIKRAITPRKVNAQRPIIHREVV